MKNDFDRFMDEIEKQISIANNIDKMDAEKIKSLKGEKQ